MPLERPQVSGMAPEAPNRLEWDRAEGGTVSGIGDMPPLTWAPLPSPWLDRAVTRLGGAGARPSASQVVHKKADSEIERESGSGPVDRQVDAGQWGESVLALSAAEQKGRRLLPKHLGPRPGREPRKKCPRKREADLGGPGRIMEAG